MTRQLIYVCFAIIMSVVSYHVYNANAVRMELSHKFGAIKSSVDELMRDNKKLEEDIYYFKDPNNLLKEARARLNYRAPNEKMIIVVPPQND